eukprot:201484-Chlamydomonas_euryale.AAC.1
MPAADAGAMPSAPAADGVLLVPNQGREACAMPPWQPARQQLGSLLNRPSPRSNSGKAMEKRFRIHSEACCCCWTYDACRCCWKHAAWRAHLCCAHVGRTACMLTNMMQTDQSAQHAC